MIGLTSLPHCARSERVIGHGENIPANHAEHDARYNALDPRTSRCEWGSRKQADPCVRKRGGRHDDLGDRAENENHDERHGKCDCYCTWSKRGCHEGLPSYFATSPREMNWP